MDMIDATHVTVVTDLQQTGRGGSGAHFAAATLQAGGGAPGHGAHGGGPERAEGQPRPGTSTH